MIGPSESFIKTKGNTQNVSLLYWTYKGVSTRKGHWEPQTDVSYTGYSLA